MVGLGDAEIAGDDGKDSEDLVKRARTARAQGHMVGCRVWDANGSHGAPT